MLLIDVIHSFHTNTTNTRINFTEIQKENNFNILLLLAILPFSSSCSSSWFSFSFVFVLFLFFLKYYDSSNRISRISQNLFIFITFQSIISSFFFFITSFRTFVSIKYHKSKTLVLYLPKTNQKNTIIKM